MFSAASVCLFVGVFVCQHDNFRTSKHRMMKLGGSCIVQKSRPSLNLGITAPGVCTPKNAAFGYDVGKISAGCLAMLNNIKIRMPSCTANVISSMYWAIKQNTVFLVTQHRSVAESVGCFQQRLCLCVCLFVCLFVNTITSERVNIG